MIIPQHGPQELVAAAGGNRTSSAEDALTQAGSNAYWRMRQAAIELAQAAGAEIHEREAFPGSISVRPRPVREPSGGQRAAPRRRLRTVRRRCRDLAGAAGRMGQGRVKALTITDKIMRSDVTPHTAELRHYEAGAAWRVSWLPQRLMDRDTAITAMILADLVSAEGGIGLAADPRWPKVDGLAAELGLSGPNAVVRASEPPARSQPAGVSGTAGAVLCAHADEDGRGAHLLEPGETCGRQQAPDLLGSPGMRQVRAYLDQLGADAEPDTALGPARRTVLRSELKRLQQAREAWDATTRACVCAPGVCSRGDFADHAGEPEGCIVCADLDPDQPCYAAVLPGLCAPGRASSERR